MERKIEGLRRVLPGRLAKNVVELYKRGRAKVIQTRYGNPAGAVRVIAIVGSYGKTTIAKLVAELLKEARRKVMVGGDKELAKEPDLALWLQRQLKAAKKDNKEFFVVEITPDLITSGALSGMTIDTVVVTSMTPEAEILLKQVVNYAVVPDNQTAGMLALAEHQVISYGEQENAEAKVDKITLYRKGTEVKMTIDHHTELTAATHLVGKANAINVAAAIATAYVLGVALDTVEEGVARLEQVKGNYQSIPGDRPYSLVVDRAEDDQSVELAAESARQLAKRRLIVALEAKKTATETLAKLKKIADRVIVASNEDIAGTETVPSVEEAVLIAQRAAKKDDTVLLMGNQFVSQINKEPTHVSTS